MDENSWTFDAFLLCPRCGKPLSVTLTESAEMSFACLGHHQFVRLGEGHGEPVFAHASA